jgi:hypothetical protein
MMEWLGGTVNKEDVGEEGTGKRQHQHHNKRKRDEDGDEDALGAFALRFKYVSVYESMRLLEYFGLGIWNSSQIHKHYYRPTRPRILN